MKSKLLAAVMAAGLSFVGWSQSASMAGIIDTRPPDQFANFLIGTGSDTAGGTFTADDTNLASFTLSIGPLGGGVFRAIVLGTAAGIPTGAPLWESADAMVPAVLTEFVFTPNLAITVGNQYFIGIDTGLRTASAGGDLQIGVRTDNPLAGGQFFEDLGSGFAGFGDFDVSSRIVMNSTQVPEPGTLALFGLGLAGFGLARRRRAG